MVNKSKLRDELNTVKCDAYCVCPNCGAGPESVKREFRYLYWPNDWNPDGSQKNGKRK